MRVIFVIMLFLSTLKTSAQFDIESQLYKQEKAFQKSCDCQLISLTFPSFGYPNRDSIPEFGTFDIQQEVYLFYKVKGEVYSKKLIRFSTDSFRTSKIAESRQIKIKTSSFFALAMDSLDRFETEEIRRYIYKWVDSASHTMTYNLMEPSDLDYFNLRMYSRDFEKAIPFKTIYLERFYHSFPENINFDYNSQTVTRKLFAEISKIIDGIDPEYRFDK